MRHQSRPNGQTFDSECIVDWADKRWFRPTGEPTRLEFCLGLLFMAICSWALLVGVLA